MHMNPDHDGSKTVDIANIAIVIIKRKEYNQFRNAHEL